MIELLDLEPRFWREGAACTDRTDVDFFPAPDRAEAIARARAVCGSCPVMDECLAFAIESNQPDGIWGGFTAKERVSLRRRWLEQLRRAS